MEEHVKVPDELAVVVGAVVFETTTVLPDAEQLLVVFVKV